VKFLRDVPESVPLVGGVLELRASPARLEMGLGEIPLRPEVCPRGEVIAVPGS